MNNKIIKFLKFFNEKIVNEKLVYRFSGDFALKIQGMKIIPKKLQIICDNFSFVEFKYLFEKYLIKEGKNNELSTNYFIIDFEGLEIDFLSFENEDIAMFDEIYQVSWEEFELSVIPLNETCKFYELINKLDKVQKVKNYLKKSKDDFSHFLVNHLF